jgi:hypothetical protein
VLVASASLLGTFRLKLCTISPLFGSPLKDCFLPFRINLLSWRRSFKRGGSNFLLLVCHISAHNISNHSIHLTAFCSCHLQPDTPRLERSSSRVKTLCPQSPLPASSSPIRRCRSWSPPRTVHEDLLDSETRQVFRERFTKVNLEPRPIFFFVFQPVTSTQSQPSCL